MARILIDGYNLMAKVDGRAGSLEARREGLLHLLSQFRTGRGHAITVVFDGERGDWPTESAMRFQGMDVVFSRMGEKADDVIKRMVEETREEWLVISSDREVASYAETCGHTAIRSEDFMGRLRNARASLNAEKPDHAEKTEEDEDTVTASKKKGNPRKLSKGARRRAQKLGGL